jgi:HK97 family phage prohead protease
MNANTARKLGILERHDLPLEAAALKFLDLEAKAKNGAVQFEGYASVWGRVDSWGDTVLRGAFTESLKVRRPLMLFGHSPGRVPGKWLEYSEDDTGLLMRGELTPGHSEAADIAASLKHGSLNGLSIGGYTTDWETTKEGTRIIKAFDLWEVSIVSMPAEDEARVDLASVKSAIDLCQKVSDVEDLLREAAGLSKSTATAIVSRLARIIRSESETVTEDREAANLAATLRSLKFPTSLIGAKK